MEIDGNIGEFNINCGLGLYLPNGFEYEISILYNSFVMPIGLKMEKNIWVNIATGLLDIDDSKCEGYIDFLDNLYSKTLDSMGGIGGELSSDMIKEIYSDNIQFLVICSIINLIHFEKIPDNDFNGFMFFRICKQEEAHKNAKLVSDCDLMQKLKLSGDDLLDHLSCFNCGCYKHHSELKKCGRCFNVCYCSKECQTEHWKIHKKNAKLFLPLSFEKERRQRKFIRNK
jgi:hypothetical protein